MEFKNSCFCHLQTQNVCSFLLLSAVDSAKFKLNKNKYKTVKIFVKKSSLTKILIDWTDWREVLAKSITKIVLPNQFPGSVDKVN